MASFNDALNDSINQINNGRTIDDCLAQYPEYADELRESLLVGQAIKQGEADFYEVQSARSRIWDELEVEIDNWSSVPTRTTRPRFIWLLTALFFIIPTATSLFFASQNSETPEPVEVILTLEITITPSQTPTPTETPMPSFTPTNTVTPSPTVIATETPIPTTVPSETPMPIATLEDSEDMDEQAESPETIESVDSDDVIPLLPEDDAIEIAESVYPSFEVVESFYNDEDDTWEIIFDTDRVVIVDDERNVIFFGFVDTWEADPIEDFDEGEEPINEVDDDNDDVYDDDDYDEPDEDEDYDEGED